MKKLVAYFSASGVTKSTAETLAKEIGADLFEIEPKEAYTKADLDWTNSSSRSTVEMKNKSFRPEMVKKTLDLSEYDTIFVGFPIWWYVAPHIIKTFFESYSFSGKKLCPLPPPAAAAWEERWMNCENSARMRIGKPVKW